MTDPQLDPLKLFERLVHAQSDVIEQDSLQELILLERDVLPILEEHLATGGAEERWWAIRILADLNDPEAAVLITNALSDPALEVRQCAALALRMHPNPAAIPALSQALNNEDRLLARLAGDALTALGGQAVPILTDILQNGIQSARVEAIRALALMDDVGAVSALFTSLNDESAVIEFWADLGLQRRGIGMVFFH